MASLSSIRLRLERVHLCTEIGEDRTSRAARRVLRLLGQSFKVGQTHLEYLGLLDNGLISLPTSPDPEIPERSQYESTVLVAHVADNYEITRFSRSLLKQWMLRSRPHMTSRGMD